MIKTETESHQHQNHDRISPTSNIDTVPEWFMSIQVKLIDNYPGEIDKVMIL